MDQNYQQPLPSISSLQQYQLQATTPAQGNGLSVPWWTLPGIRFLHRMLCEKFENTQQIEAQLQQENSPVQIWKDPPQIATEIILPPYASDITKI